MAQFFDIHPDNPQARLVRRAADMVRDGALIAWPTDSCYAFAFAIGNKDAAERARQLRRVADDHFFTLVAGSIAQLSPFVKLGNNEFRFIKNLVPGPYTFITDATRELPRRLQNPKRKTAGIRIPDHRIVQAVVAELGEPMMSTTLMLPDDDLPLTEGEGVDERIGKQIDLVIGGGVGGITYSTLIDLTQWPPKMLRQGVGEAPAGVAA
ncbi:L-threonylcarbamoyladenylate synthase [Gammaproteobacteria bacterium]|nr:L-threonylcarbamoyladenylate synthase [Gammaproteobacteria bacterium]